MAVEILHRMHDTHRRYTEHLLSLEDLQSELSTRIDVADPSLSQGISSDLAHRLLQQFGPNSLTPPARVPLWLLFMIQFTNLFMVLLMAAGFLCLVLFAIKPSDPTNLYLGNPSLSIDASLQAHREKR